MGSERAKAEAASVRAATGLEDQRRHVKNMGTMLDEEGRSGPNDLSYSEFNEAVEAQERSQHDAQLVRFEKARVQGLIKDLGVLDLVERIEQAVGAAYDLGVQEGLRRNVEAFTRVLEERVDAELDDSEAFKRGVAEGEKRGDDYWQREVRRLQYMLREVREK